jgi:hypothetical protein
VTSTSDPHYSSIDTHGHNPIGLPPSPTFPRLRVSPRVRTRRPLMPEWIWQPFVSWHDLSVASLSPAWRRTTILMWGAWMSTSAGEHNVRYCGRREVAHGLAFHRIHSFQLVLPQASRTAPWETRTRRYLSAKCLVERGNLHPGRDTWVYGKVL